MVFLLINILNQTSCSNCKNYKILKKKSKSPVILPPREKYYWHFNIFPNSFFSLYICVCTHTQENSYKIYSILYINFLYGHVSLNIIPGHSMYWKLLENIIYNNYIIFYLFYLIILFLLESSFQFIFHYEQWGKSSTSLSAFDSKPYNFLTMFS